MKPRTTRQRVFQSCFGQTLPMILRTTIQSLRRCSLAVTCSGSGPRRRGEVEKCKDSGAGGRGWKRCGESRDCLWRVALENAARRQTPTSMECGRVTDGIKYYHSEVQPHLRLHRLYSTRKWNHSNTTYEQRNTYVCMDTTSFPKRTQ